MQHQCVVLIFLGAFNAIFCSLGLPAHGGDILTSFGFPQNEDLVFGFSHAYAVHLRIASIVKNHVAWGRVVINLTIHGLLTHCG